MARNCLLHPAIQECYEFPTIQQASISWTPFMYYGFLSLVLFPFDKISLTSLIGHCINITSNGPNNNNNNNNDNNQNNLIEMVLNLWSGYATFALKTVSHFALYFFSMEYGLRQMQIDAQNIRPNDIKKVRLLTYLTLGLANALLYPIITKKRITMINAKANEKWSALCSGLWTYLVKQFIIQLIIDGMDLAHAYFSHQVRRRDHVGDRSRNSYHSQSESASPICVACQLNPPKCSMQCGHCLCTDCKRKIGIQLCQCPIS